MASTNRINLVVAHSAEARPLCELLGLKTTGNTLPFPVYRNASGMSLIVSGMGKLAAATATSFLAGVQAQSPKCAWLNIGIAGHQSAAVGCGLLANKITDAATGQCFYPPPVIANQPSAALVTVDHPEQNYPDAVLYDMEASGFYASASKFMSSELVQVFKIVSDNQQYTLAQFELSQVADLVRGQFDQVRAIINSLDLLLGEYRRIYGVSPQYNVLVEKYPFTKTQRVQLQRLCERFDALGLSDELEQIGARSFNSRNDVLTVLRDRLTRVSGN